MRHESGRRGVKDERNPVDEEQPAKRENDRRGQEKRGEAERKGERLTWTSVKPKDCWSLFRLLASLKEPGE